ncbi:MAG TPA: GreA/GreB family elongation factor [Kiritimatiellia bacterium]|nr:GreA/GreB family elongation factor [Kiritimatiellia bacterium]HNR93228.1 GreA/GreB family elongation factor [Kiritimatiellia bacterium]HNS81107.1 GreA/GreB family elongation factor [Kiritimatiellia bacterium]HPA77567.1 GreA/GreB family elongation factor [Kiritimatiellia bacterium]HQQ03605.1 GreA/GreB family elongation factor [Kiritimatiellia bacterium]
MQDLMIARKITCTLCDYNRLRSLLTTAQRYGLIRPALLRMLEDELGRAEIVASEEVPPYVVTMNTCVCLTDLATGASMQYKLVYPDDEDIRQGRLSILSELGAAIIGFSVGDTIEWNFADGPRYIRIDMILYQPEAVHHFE